MKTNEKVVEEQATATAEKETVKTSAAEQPVEDPEYEAMKQEFKEKIKAFNDEMAELAKKSKGRLGAITCGYTNEGSQYGISLAVAANGKAQVEILKALRDDENLRTANMMLMLQSLKGGISDMLK